MSKRYRLKREVLNYSSGSVISVGEIFEQIEGTRKYMSKSGWMMSEEACLKIDWFEEIKPEPKEDNEFVWTDELVLEILNASRTIDQKIVKFSWGDNHLKEFKKSKQQPPVKEKIEVEFDFMFPYDKRRGGGAYTLSSSEIISEDKLLLIKSVIEKILNNEP